MRLRTSVAAAVGALALVIALPASAGAAQGDFTYQHYTETGISQTSALVDPQSRECITLPEVQDETTAPAHSPRNNTDATATVFAGADCEGPYFTLRPNGGHASERLLVRSVVFS
ncbi:hypothetical protein GCM10011583_07720 [Streptomyces camponoticapitis]|uniref:Secreted protein n=1 Tax=Streptomyces camponoticapitis TaxID=1616125 RepID=A0ABQ2DYJ8_9ACTN|nr:hypothetical protein [Streptomyces camponoticapitis]GGJ78593.1 hypothetical protein GCM10011583_07720 [Streptomyces camponoticapitis]